MTGKQLRARNTFSPTRFKNSLKEIIPQYVVAIVYYLCMC